MVFVPKVKASLGKKKPPVGKLQKKGGAKGMMAKLGIC